MRIGLPTEIKADERRVALTPGGVRELCERGHELLVQSGAGAGAGHPDDAYKLQGATILQDAEELFAEAQMIVKVKEPQPTETRLLGPDHILVTYLHLAADADLTRALLASRATCFAYETVTDESGSLPLLAPMSEIAGKLAGQLAARTLESTQRGAGVLIGGVAGIPPAEVMVIGAGVVGINAARVLGGLGGRVTLYDIAPARLRAIEDLRIPNCNTCISTAVTLEESLPSADVVIGAVLIPGAKAPHVLSADQLSRLRPGRVVIDVSIDQGGCFETSRPTTHSKPSYMVGDVVHSCVANLPGCVPLTATAALTNATLPYITQIAELGAVRAASADPGLARGLTVIEGQLTSSSVAAAHGLTATPLEDTLPAAA